MGSSSILRAIVILFVVLFAELAALADQRVTLAWNPSPSVLVFGYHVYYGAQPGNYTNRVNAGNSTSTSITGLQPGVTYYFAVKAYNFDGLESPPSNEISYVVPVPLPSFKLSLEQVGNKVPSTKTFAIKGTGTLPTKWMLEASYDLKTWWPLTCGTNGTNPLLNVPTVVAGREQMYFRLKSPMPGVRLKMEKGPAGSAPDSYCLSSTAAWLPSWTLESSVDLKNWSPMVNGTNCAVNIPVVTSKRDAIFFRLKGM